VAAQQDRIVWFPKDWILGVLLTIPVWWTAGLVWGGFMFLFMGGSLIGWLIVGLLWGASMWFVFSLVILVACRERSTSIPVDEPERFPGRLGAAVKSFRYKVEQVSPTSFVCRPNTALARLFPFEYTKIHVHLHDGRAELIGPSQHVNKVRKHLLGV
jgi:hypothetical protein